MRTTILRMLCAGLLGLSLAAQAATPDKLVRKMHKSNLMEIEMGGLAQQNGSTDEVRSYGKMLVEDHQKADVALLGYASKAGIQMADKDMDHKAIDKMGMGKMDQDMPMGGDKKIADKATDNSAAVPDAKTVERNSDKTASPGSTATNDKTGAGDNPDMTGKAHEDQPTDRSAKVDNDGDERDGKMMMMEQLKTSKGRAFDTQFMTMMVKGHQKNIAAVTKGRASLAQGDELAALIDKTLPVMQKHLDKAQKILNKLGPQARRPY